jgi:RNA polymerase sigma-70 factor (ECF subfamily)
MTAEFATTQWSLVLRAGGRSSADAHDALAELCRIYWYPVYAFMRRKLGDADRAGDFTQEFFLRLLERNTIAAADPARGRFRYFLLAACHNFLVNEVKKAATLRRGGGQSIVSLDVSAADSHYSWEPADSDTPQRTFERAWVLCLLERVLAQLQKDYQNMGKRELFDALRDCITPESARYDYTQIGEKLGMSPGAVKVAAHRLRQRFRERIRTEILATLDDPNVIEDEIRQLFEAVAS